MTVLASTDFILDVGYGLRPGYDNVQVAGINRDIDTANIEDIWNIGGVKTWFTTAVQLDIVSTDTGDTSAGAGARSLIIEGLDANFDPLPPEIIALNGTTTVTTVNSYIRVNLAAVNSSGTYGSTTAGANLGTITVEQTGGGNPQAQLDIGKGRSENTHFTIPNGKCAQILQAILTVDDASPAEIDFIIREDADIIVAPFSPKIIVPIGVATPAGVHVIPLDTGIALAPKTDLWAIAQAGSNNATVKVAYELNIVDEILVNC